MDKSDKLTTLSKKNKRLRGRELFATLPDSSLNENLSSLDNELLLKKSSIEVQNYQIEKLSKKIENESFQYENELKKGSSLKLKISTNKENLEILDFKLEKIEENFEKLQIVNNEFRDELVDLEKVRSKKEKKLRLLEGQLSDLNCSVTSLQSRRRNLTRESQKIDNLVEMKRVSVEKLVLVLDKDDAIENLKASPNLPSVPLL